MKTSMTKVSAALALVAMSGAAIADISNTRHNLGSTGLTPNTTSATTEICVFCHTPHGSDSSAAVPLWNRNLQTAAAAAYQTYATINSSTLNADSTTIGSVSLACLSCHDGTQAVNSMLNQPGFNNTLNLTSMAQGAGNFVEFLAMSTLAGGGDAMLYIGTDLTNDHPIGIQYAGAVPGVGAGAHPVIDPDFKSATEDTTATNGLGTLYFIGSGAALGAKGANDLPLYNRSGGTLDGQPLVECATCHDPHAQRTSFLRNVNGNNGSATCLACHTK